VPANAIPLTENQWADGNLPTSSDVQWFSFTATAFNQYLHAAFGTLTDLYVQVYTSGGATVGSETNLYGSTTNTSRTLSSGQTYYIRVRPCNSNYSGTYQIAFNASTTAPNVQVPANAIPLTVNVWADGSIPTDGQQWFVFTATASPQYIHFSTIGSLTDVYVQVYDSNSGAVGSETNLSSSTTNISLTLSSGQRYYIRVKPYNTSGTGSSGTYQIAFNTSTTAPNFQLPAVPIPLTENVWANIPTAGGVQWFTFTATASTQYIHFKGSSLTQVYDSSGGAVGSETNLSTSAATPGRTSVSLISGKTYYIRVRNSSGTYQIGFNKSTTAPGGSRNEAIPITANQWADGNLLTFINEEWFSFTATASTQYIHFSTSGTLKDVYVQVYNSSGTTTVGNETNLYGSGTNTRTSRSLTSGQTYYIKVRPYGSSSSDTNSRGTYRIAFNTSSTAPN